MPVDADRRLRQRLGLEARARHVWMRPAIAALAVAIAALVVIFYPAKQARLEHPVTTTITAAPGTHVTRTSESTVLLTRGSIEVERKDAKPMFVDVPMGRVVIAAYHSTVTVDPERVTIVLGDGSGHYDDPTGRSHPLAPNAPFVWPPPLPSSPPANLPARPPRPRAKVIVPPPLASPKQELQAPPGETPPSVPVRPDAPCTYKSDCDEGQTCRENERKESVCMGNGGEGAACWFDNDCLSQHCVQRRCSR
jgi:hypothetical protein